MRGAKPLLLPLLVAATLGLPGQAPAEAHGIRWDRVIGAEPSRLRPEQREQAATIMRREHCYHGCSRSIARCLEAPRPSRTTRRLAGYVVRQVLHGRSAKNIRQGIRQRGLSAQPLVLANINLAHASCLGPAQAPVTVVEYADFECPYCRVVSPILHRLVGALRPRVRLCFKHFPVRGHRRALPTAFAALAASQQGRFWPMHDALYASAPRLQEPDIRRCARGAGIADLPRWQRDRRNSSLRSRIETDKLEGLRNGVRGTPTLFINRKQYLGRMNRVELRDRLEEELDLVRGRG